MRYHPALPQYLSSKAGPSKAQDRRHSSTCRYLLSPYMRRCSLRYCPSQTHLKRKAEKRAKKVVLFGILACSGGLRHPGYPGIIIVVGGKNNCRWTAGLDR